MDYYASLRANQTLTYEIFFLENGVDGTDNRNTVFHTLQFFIFIFA